MLQYPAEVRIGTLGCPPKQTRWTAKMIARRVALALAAGSLAGPALARPRFPVAPTLRELGYDMVVTSPYGIAGPKGMDPGVVRVLHDAAKAALFDPASAAVRAHMPLGCYDTEDYRSFIVRRAEYEKAMAQRLNLRINLSNDCWEKT